MKVEKCKYCGDDTNDEGLFLCDDCWELGNRIDNKMSIARKIIKEKSKNKFNIKKVLKWVLFYLIYKKLLAILWLSVGVIFFLDVTIVNWEYWVFIIPSIFLFTWVDNYKIKTVFKNY